MELFSFIPSLLLVQLFRRIKQRNNSRQKISPLVMIKRTENKFFNNSKVKQQKHVKVTFPWWCIFLAYIISIIFVGISILFIIARSIQLGDIKTQKWLTSVMIGFFSSIFFIQPLKVLYTIFDCLIKIIIILFRFYV